MAETTPEEQSAQPPQSGVNIMGLKEHIWANKINVALWAIRVLTIIFTLGYFIPIFGSAHNAFYKALMANAATNALRLHQRLQGIQFTREFLTRLLLEDSCHYLFFSLIFMYVSPVTLVLLPGFLFAILHAASYSLTLLDTLGQNSWWGARLLISLVEFQSRNILRLAAFTEIVLMPMTLLLIMMGKAGLLTPFIYYHFLAQRYSSRRNPYTRNMFHELRMLTESTANKAPALLRNLLLSIVNLVCKMAPAMPPLQHYHQQQQQQQQQ